MESSSATPVRAGLEMRGSRASSVIVHEAPPDKTDRFLEWQEGITLAAQDFAGYLGTDVYPPAGDRRDEWVAAIHFDSPETRGLPRVFQWLPITTIDDCFNIYRRREPAAAESNRSPDSPSVH